MLRAFCAVVTIGVVVGGGSIAGARPGPPPPPEGPAWQVWRDAISKRFSYRKVAFRGEGRRPAEAFGRDGCPALQFQSPGMVATVLSPNPKVFGFLAILIFPLSENADGNAFIKQALATHPQEESTFPCLAVGNTAVSFMQAGRFWVMIQGSCADGDLYGYEVGEVVEMIREMDPANAPTTFAYSPCGKVVPTVVSTESFLAGLKQKKSFWGRTFPAAREAAKKALAH